MRNIDAQEQGDTLKRVGAMLVSFTEQERLVLHLAQREPLGSARLDGMFARCTRFLLGIRLPSRLADPRLEALRCAGILSRYGRVPPVALTVALLSYGFTTEQVAMLMTFATSARRARPHA